MSSASHSDPHVARRKGNHHLVKYADTKTQTLTECVHTERQQRNEVGQRGCAKKRQTFTLNELHDDVDGLFLSAHSYQLHNVRMVVLLQDPGQHRRPVCVCVHGCVNVCARVCAHTHLASIRNLFFCSGAKVSLQVFTAIGLLSERK